MSDGLELQVVLSLAGRVLGTKFLVFCRSNMD